MKIKKKDIQIKISGTDNVISARVILDNPPPKTEYLLGRWLAEKSCTMIHSNVGVGKSWLAAGIAFAVAGKGKLAKWEASASYKVMYVDGEMSIQSLHKRLSLLHGNMTFEDKESAGNNLQLIKAGDGVFIDNDEAINYYTEKVKKYDLSLLIIDNLRTLSDLTEENSASSWKKINRFLIAMRKHCAVILVHHNGKGRGYAGSTNAVTVLDNQIGLSKIPYDQIMGKNLKESGVQFTYEFHKARDSFSAPLKGMLGFNDDHGWVDNSNRAIETTIKLAETAELAASGDFESWKELAKHLGISEFGLRKRRTAFKKHYSEEMALTKPNIENEHDSASLSTLFE
jgi:AAA domain